MNLGKTVSRHWYDLLRYVLDIFHVVRRTGAAPWLLVFGLLFIVALPQGQEMIRMLGDHSRPLWLANHLFLLGSSAVWGMAVWYCSRALLAVRETRAAAPLEQSPWLQWLREWLPRAMGALAAAGVGFSAAITESWWIMAEHFALSVSLLVFFANRRQWFCHLLRECDREGVPEAGPVSLRSAPFLILALSLGISLLLMCSFLLWPVALPRFVGALAVLQLALAAWVVFFNFEILFLGHLLRLPALGLIMLVWLVLASPFNDNHGVRREAAPVADRPSLASHFESWAKARGSAGDVQLPVVIVAAEGGGVRAAYWTAGVLAAIEDRSTARRASSGNGASSGFLDHLYALSGVSGGAVGSSAFAALVAQTAPGTLPSCSGNAQPPRGWQTCAVSLFRNDYLAPNLAALLYADMLQRFVPYSIPQWDRALAMEYAAQDDWQALFGQTTLAAPTQALWRDMPGSARTPALFINGTLAESGQRIIGSNVRIDGVNFADAYDLYDVRDKEGRQDRREMPLISAIHLSARFPFISPAGTLEAGGKAFAHVIDGGYFENAGTATALEVLDAVSSNYPGARAVRPIIVSIRNEPAEAGDCRNSLDQPEPFGGAIRWLSDLLIPPIGLYATRTSRTGYTDGLIRARVQALRKEGVPAAYVRLCLASSQPHPPPLGWTLSAESREEMDTALGRIARGEDVCVERLIDAIRGGETKDAICPTPTGG